MNIQEQYFKGVPDYYPSMYLDGYTPQQIMYAVRNYWRPAEITSKGPARKANCGAKEKAITEFFQILYTEQ